MKDMNPKKVALARLLRPVWRVWGWFVRGPVLKRIPESILIFDFHLIGDIVLLTPLLRAVHQGFPGARVTLVAGPWAQEILKDTSWVDEIIPFSAPWVKYGQGWRGWWRCLLLVRRLRKRSWDLGIEIRGDVRQILLLTMVGAERRVGYDLTGGKELLTDVVLLPTGVEHLAAGYHRGICEYLGIWHGGEYVPALTLSEAERSMAAERVEFVGIHFGASLPLRRPPLALMYAFIDELVRVNAHPLVIYRIKETPEIADLLHSRLVNKHKINAEVWEGSLRDFIVHLSRCRKLYCLDSGPAHIAAALGVEVTVIYGPTLADITRPLGSKVNVVAGRDLRCRPCDQRHCVAEHHQECFLAGSSWI